MLRLGYIEFRKIPILRSFLESADYEIKKRGIIPAAKYILKERVDLVVDYKDPAIKKILSRSSVILVCNHPSDSDPVFLFASIPNRKDVKLCISSSFFTVSPALNKHLIPIYIRNCVRKKAPSPLAMVAIYLPFMKKIDDKTAHIRNIESIKMAARAVDKGEMVIIYPGPKVYGKEERWQAGLGYMIKQVKKRKDNVYIVYANIQGSSKLDFLRLSKNLAKYLPKIKIRFIGYKRLSDVNLKSYPKRIVRDLETDYKKRLKTENGNDIAQ